MVSIRFEADLWSGDSSHYNLRNSIYQIIGFFWWLGVYVFCVLSEQIQFQTRFGILNMHMFFSMVLFMSKLLEPEES
jgi:hypothetical protein